MAYCTIDDVAELNTGRTFTTSSKPNATQVNDFIEQTAAVIDGILRSQNYSLPIATTATSALKMLELFNAQGAACLVEQGAPTSDRRGAKGDGVCAMWREAQKMLKGGGIELDADRDTSESHPRGGPCATPFFTREMTF